MSVHGVAIRVSCRNGRITNPSYKEISATLGLTELVLDHGRVLFPLMLRASAEAILQLACRSLC